ncbi:hypothetical protein LTS12_029384, partial [Elasticomyces elasticus]
RPNGDNGDKSVASNGVRGFVLIKMTVLKTLRLLEPQLCPRALRRLGAKQIEASTEDRARARKDFARDD